MQQQQQSPRREKDLQSEVVESEQMIPLARGHSERGNDFIVAVVNDALVFVPR